MKIVTNLKKLAKLNDAIKAADVTAYYITYYIESDEAKEPHVASIVEKSSKKAIEKLELSVRDRTGEDIVVRDVSCV